MQIDWNTNILNNSSLLSMFGFTAAQVTSITNDCTLTIYLLSSVGEMADSTYASLHGLVLQWYFVAVATGKRCFRVWKGSKSRIPHPFRTWKPTFRPQIGHLLL